jgi:hypothetical protein
MEVNSTEIAEYVSEFGVYDRRAIRHHLCAYGKDALIGTTVAGGKLCNVYDLDSLIEAFEDSVENSSHYDMITRSERYVVWLEKLREEIGDFHGIY